MPPVVYAFLSMLGVLFRGPTSLTRRERRPAAPAGNLPAYGEATDTWKCSTTGNDGTRRLTTRLRYRSRR